MNIKINENRTIGFNQIYGSIFNQYGDKIIQVTYQISSNNKELFVDRLENRTFGSDEEENRLTFKGAAHAFLCTLVALEKLAENITDDFKISLFPAYITGGTRDLTKLKEYYKSIGLTKQNNGTYSTTIRKFLDNCFNVKPSEEIKVLLNELRATYTMKKSHDNFTLEEKLSDEELEKLILELAGKK